MSDKQEIIFTSALITQNYKHNEKSECQILGVSKNFIDKSEKKFIFYFWKGQASWHIPCQYWHLAWSCVWWISEAVADESPTPCKFFYLIENSKIFFHTDVHEIQQLRIGFLCSVGFSYFFTTPSFLKHLFANPSPLFITIYMYLYVLHVFV